MSQKEPMVPRKKATKVKKRNKKGETSVRLPDKNSKDFSSNWKKLLSTMEKSETTKPARKPYKKTFTKPPAENKKQDIWFDDVDPDLLDPEDRPDSAAPKKDSSGNNLVKEKSFQGLTKCLAMDCEMVGVGFQGKDSILARVSIVNLFGHCIYDKYVKPTEKVTDYRTKVSGIRPNDIKDGEEFKLVQKEVSDMLRNRILVGHSIKHDLKVLLLDHPRKMIRDTSEYKPFRVAFGGRTPSLKNLTARMLGVSVQEGEHSSVQDAQATMRLYTMHKKQWENEISQLRSKRLAERKPKKPSKPLVEKNPSEPNRARYQDSSDSE